MRKQYFTFGTAVLFPACLFFAVPNPAGLAQNAPERALFHFADSVLPSPLVLVGFGDMRCTDPRVTQITAPVIRRKLFDKIAEVKPFAVILSGDVPWRGGAWEDYEAYQKETAPWVASHIFISPALGNHETAAADRWVVTFPPDGKPLRPEDIVSNPNAVCTNCIENWWKAFPQLAGHRWYSVEVGSRVTILNLDSNSSVQPGTSQYVWIKDQLANLPESVKFVFLNLHHPPVTAAPRSDDPDLKPLIALLNEGSAARRHAKFIVVAGHLHNYERFLKDDTVYLISGGGGAAPVDVTAQARKEAGDLYKGPPKENYNYVKFTLREKVIDAEMVRLENADDVENKGSQPKWAVRERFQVVGK
jgi:hypothetical protein